MFERKCMMCGKVFPMGTPASRKYCYDCLAIRHQEERIRHREKEREKARKKAEEAKLTAKKPPKTLQRKDKDYCSKCEYCGNFTEDYLCNYLLITGQVRGCKAGVDCTRFTIRTKEDNIRICERCGSKYEGSKNTHFCQACRVEALRENARRMNNLKYRKEN